MLFINDRVELQNHILPKLGLPTVSLFTGAGGLDFGLEAVGFSTCLSTDIDEHCYKTLLLGKQSALQRQKPFFNRAMVLPPTDIRELSAKGMFSGSEMNFRQIELLCGGPPCQAFSVFGKRRGRLDPRGELAFEYLRIVAELKPTAFIFENVAGLLTIEDGRIYQELCARLANPIRGLHYTISTFRLNAVDYGVPQFRDRVFIIGHSGGRMLTNIPAVCSSNGSSRDVGLPRWRTVRNALRDLPPIGSGNPPNHIGRMHSDRIIDRYRSLKPGERDHHTRINRLDLDRPSFAIIVGSDKGGGKGHVHPTEPREVTPRESARIQTFPDWWGFSGTSRHPIRQVGNAVPPLLAAAIGNEIRSQFFDLPRIPFEHILELLDQGHLFLD